MAMYLKSFSLGLFPLFIFSVYCGEIKDRFTLRRDGYRLKDASTTEEHQCTSLMTCTSICSHSNWCISVSFNPNQGRCLLSTNDVTFGVNADDYLTPETDWITMSKAFFTVFHQDHPNGPYQATYDDAVAICASLNTVVASEADLLASRAMGMDVCACGWLCNQMNGFILQSPDWSCWHSFNDQVIYCGISKANAWCRL